MESFSKQQRE